MLRNLISYFSPIFFVSVFEIFTVTVVNTLITRNLLHKFLFTNVTLFNTSHVYNNWAVATNKYSGFVAKKRWIMGWNPKYYGIHFDHRRQNFGFHMIAQSQLMTDNHRWSQKIEHGSIFCGCLQSRSQDRRRCVSIWSQTIAELFAICDHLRSYGNQLLELCASIDVKYKCRLLEIKKEYMIVHVFV